VCRSDRALPANERAKIALFTNVEERAVIGLKDVDSIYKIPAILKAQGLDEIVIARFRLDRPEADLSEWEQVLYQESNPSGEVTIGFVGKYIELPDAYKSVNEALAHAGLKNRLTVNIRYIDAQDVETKGVAKLADVDAIIVPGGFGERGIKGKIMAAQYAREQKIPYLGICLGMQIAIIEYARNILGWADADSTEFNPKSSHPVVGLITEWMDEKGQKELRDNSSDLGGTMRLGAQACNLVAGTRAHSLYGKDVIRERHRHRYEVNGHFVEQLQQAGLKVSGWSFDNRLVEVIEIPDHPWFVAAQFHPEFNSTPRDGHPLFKGFIEAAGNYQKMSRA
jgi:CTP synthase